MFPRFSINWVFLRRFKRYWDIYIVYRDIIFSSYRPALICCATKWYLNETLSMCRICDEHLHSGLQQQYVGIQYVVSVVWILLVCNMIHPQHGLLELDYSVCSTECWLENLGCMKEYNCIIRMTLMIIMGSFFSPRSRFGKIIYTSLDDEGGSMLQFSTTLNWSPRGGPNLWLVIITFCHSP